MPDASDGPLAGPTAPVRVAGVAVGAGTHPDDRPSTMIDVATLIDHGVTAVQLFGIPALFVCFLLKGALIGKVVPTSVVLPGYVVAVGASWRDAALVVLVVTVAHLLGQLVVFGASRRYGDAIHDRLPSATADGAGARRVDDWFDRYGGPAIVATNVVPWSRGLIAIPAGVGDYPVGRYLTYTGVSTLAYHAVYVAVPLAGLAMVG